MHPLSFFTLMGVLHYLQNVLFVLKRNASVWHVDFSVLGERMSESQV